MFNGLIEALGGVAGLTLKALGRARTRCLGGDVLWEADVQRTG